MKTKNIELLVILASQDSWVTSFAISAACNISVRTVKSCIADINLAHPNLVESSRNGFRVTDKDRLASIIKADSRPSPQTSDDRRKFILKKLLLERSQVDFDELAGALSISPATLQNELPRIKNLLSEYELIFHIKHNRASIEGPEFNKKKMISRLIYDDTRESFLSIKLIQSYLPNFDLADVKEIITAILRERHYFLDDFSLLNFVLHIAITMERKLAQGDAVQPGQPLPPVQIAPHIAEIVREVTETVSARFGVFFDEADRYNFALLIMTRVISVEIHPETQNRLSEIVGDDVIRIVSIIQARIKENYNITITNEDFTVRFSLHLKNLIVRLQNTIVLRNPQMLDIKNSYPFIYDVSVFITNIITQETGYEINEDEISYIALHIGVLIEERKVIKYEVRAVLLFPQYYVTSSDMVERISCMFKNNLLINGVTSSEDELDGTSDYDLIISTIPLKTHAYRPNVKISAFLNTQDMLAISSKIESVLIARMKAKVKGQLHAMIKEALFFVNTNFRNQDDAINVMGDALFEQGYVDFSFKKQLFEREKVSSSAYLNIAMPHPLEMSALKSVIAISVHPAPIAWNNARVNIVFLLAINSLDRLFFKDIFEFITEVISEEKKLRSLVEVTSYEEFIEKLVSYAG